MKALQDLRFGYVPYSATFDRPGDRRRFVHYAQKRSLQFELADPSKAYDVVVLSERADVSVWQKYRQGKVVYDLIDSYLAIPTFDWKGLLRGTAKFLSRQSRYPQLNYWEALRAMCRRADAVVCTTLEQQNQIREFCPNTHIVLDFHTMVMQTTKSNYAAAKPFRIVWEGLPQTLGSLAAIREPLKELQLRTPIELRVITDPEYFRFLGGFGRTRTQATLDRILPGAILHPWQETTLAQQICDCDLAIIPIDLNDPFVAGKPENKLLLFWRLGMPTLASASPAYTRAMTAANQDLTCRTQAEWVEKLEQLIGDESARRHAGESAYVFAQTKYSEADSLQHWDTVFHSLFASENTACAA